MARVGEPKESLPACGAAQCEDAAGSGTEGIAARDFKAEEPPATRIDASARAVAATGDRQTRAPERRLQFSRQAEPAA